MVGSAFLDLFAGTGGIGIEALSRGAEQVVFVDDSRKSLDAVRHNLEQAGVSGRAQVIASKAESFLKRTGERFDILFLDPPYSMDLAPLLAQIAGTQVLAPEGIVVAEHFKKQPSPERAGALERYREAVYGDTVLAFYRKNIGSKESGARGQEVEP